MSFMTVRKKLFQRNFDEQDLVVRGNRILFVTKNEVAFADMKNRSHSAANSAVSGANQIASVESNGVPLHGMVEKGCSHKSGSEKEASLRNMITVDRAIQVGSVSSDNGFESHGIAKESTPAMDNKANIFGDTNKERMCDIERHPRLTSVIDPAQTCDTSNKGGDVVPERNQQEHSFAQQLKVLADECSNESPATLELKDSTYLVLKEAHGVVLVHFPQDLKEEDSFNLASALLETDDDDADDVDLASHASLSSVELLTSESTASSPIPFIRRKTLYPEPCPAFPMEVSFPPVEFE